MINLIRCDDRLIHGQCMTRLVQHYFIKNIIVIDEFTATNPRIHLFLPVSYTHLDVYKRQVLNGAKIKV